MCRSADYDSLIRPTQLRIVLHIPIRRIVAARAAAVAGVSVIESDAAHEGDEALASRLPNLGVSRVRLVGVTAGTGLRRAAITAHVHLADQPVVASGRVELLLLVREQSVSITRHRFGNPLPGRWPW